jgi:hypothetical protein
MIKREYQLFVERDAVSQKEHDLPREGRTLPICHNLFGQRTPGEAIAPPPERPR